ncbi:DUF3237 domain-containing protein [Aporhodopirellula aestuarii]|uniref:UPF0311 protein NB063_26045 n=1 Tax=Aporhodopirellula aestuarii TaxID=2950107 RepID=A0ABT0UAU2_9BACT|nr:DUF3237 domain-containing protein [Aporhodopirellula aestuarii]MCM2374092.1 DUF3237 domain-containing protein [Aporhodopirellula aestuarii]
MIDYKMEPLFSYTATVGNPEIVGPVPGGVRVNFNVTGGVVCGDKISGKILPAGGDWLLMRNDGVADVDVRLTIRTEDDALINVHYHGMADLGENGFEEFMAGRAPVPGTPLRIFPRFHVAAEKYSWLNRLACIGVGEAHVDFATESKMIFDIYAVN